ncbi:MAG: HAMP domain-containing sensor histidine kinase [Calditrichia bacterium]
MKNISRSFYGKLSLTFLILLLILGAAQIFITINSSMKFMEEAEQRLNISLAENMAAELTPFLRDSLSVSEIGQAIHYMMVLNPKIEIYLLDDGGKILAFFADPPKKVKKEYVDVEPIHRFLANPPKSLVLGEDPRQPDQQKPFSAAGIRIGPNTDGFVYVILGGEQYDSAVNMIKESYIFRTSISSLLLIFAITGLIGLILFSLITRRLRSATEVVKKFKQGDLSLRIPEKKKDEIGQLAGIFNKMADTIVANMEELKRTDNLRRELVANISHDLRSPLASIQGYLETILIKDTGLTDGERKQYLEIILNNTMLLSKLVEELFELSKLDACQVPVKTEIFSVSELVQDVALKYQPQAEKSKIILEAILPEYQPFVEADIGLIERALSNLIENAIRYTPSGGKVKVAVSADEQNYIKIMVSDSGPGIAREDLPYIFDRFYRAERSRNRQRGGTGLGLAISKKILELHNSKLAVESREIVVPNFILD